jgi:Fic family protein
LADLYEDEALGGVPRADVLEVRNYLTAHEYGLERLKTLPLSLRLLRELHAKLMEGVRGENRHPGEFRSYQNWIARDPRAPIENATYVPPPVPETKHALGDGNGRVGRLLISLFLHDRGQLPQPLLYLSAYFERTRMEYYERLLRVSTHGDWHGWLTYFLTGVRLQANAAVKDAEQLLDLQASYHRQLADARARPAAREMMDPLFVNPYVTARRVADLLQVSNPTARAAIGELVERGILRETTGRRWGRLWVAKRAAFGEASGARGMSLRCSLRMPRVGGCL